IMYTAQLGLKRPIAIRYPRGRGEIIHWQMPFEKIEIGKGIQLKEGSEIAILSVGRIANTVNNSIESIKDPDKIAHFDMRFIKPLDETLLHTILTTFKTVITIEDGVLKGGFGSAVAEFMIENGY